MASSRYGVSARLTRKPGALFTGGGLGFEGNLNGRLGAILGGNILAYGEAGVGVITPGAFTYTAGGGVEVAVGPAMSLFGETKLLGTFGGGCCGFTVQGGVNWHPGY